MVRALVPLPLPCSCPVLALTLQLPCPPIGWSFKLSSLNRVRVGGSSLGQGQGSCRVNARTCHFQPGRCGALTLPVTSSLTVIQKCPVTCMQLVLILLSYFMYTCSGMCAVQRPSTNCQSTKRRNQKRKINAARCGLMGDPVYHCLLYPSASVYVQEGTHQPCLLVLYVGL